jgi:hypothetical protein
MGFSALHYANAQQKFKLHILWLTFIKGLNRVGVLH